MTDADHLRGMAKDAEELARNFMAIALAMEDGELTSEDAREAISLVHSDESLALIRSDVYPGDEYYDRAVSELDGYE